jgi:hypothetical protein
MVGVLCFFLVSSRLPSLNSSLNNQQKDRKDQAQVQNQKKSANRNVLCPYPETVEI